MTPAGVEDQIQIQGFIVIPAERSPHRKAQCNAKRNANFGPMCCGGWAIALCYCFVTSHTLYRGPLGALSRHHTEEIR